MRWLLYGLLLLLPYSSNAQNLVPNWGFEEYIDCPPGLATLTCASWYQFTQSNPDYFNTCSKNKYSGAPINIFGYKQPYEKGCIGLLTYFKSVSDLKEYIATYISPMKQGVAYKVSMSVSLADSSGYATDDLGIYFGDTSGGLNTNTTLLLPVSPDIIFSAGVPVTSKANWTRLSAIYTPTKNINHMVIGGFLSYNNMQLQAVPPGKSECYYFIDNIEIIEEKLAVPVPGEAVPLSVYPSPNNGNFTLKCTTSDKLHEIEVVNMMGQVVYHKTVQANNGFLKEDLSLPVAAPGMYMLSLRSASGSRNLKFAVN